MTSACPSTHLPQVIAAGGYSFAPADLEFSAVRRPVIPTKAVRTCNLARGTMEPNTD